MSAREIVEAHFEVFSTFGDELVISCPSPDHDDQAPSCWVNTRKELWTCYSCGAGGRLEDILPDGVHLSAEIDIAELEQLINELEQGPQHTRPLSERWLDQYLVLKEERLEYWHEQRGISFKSISEFKLGVDPETLNPVYPIHDVHGQVLGVVERRRDGKPKYKYPSGVKVHEHLFGAFQARPERSRDLVLTEGAIDALAMWDAGYVALAQYGSRLGPTQVGIIQALAPRSLTLVFDNDQAGRDAIDAVDELDVGAITLVNVCDWEAVCDHLGHEYKDPAEVPIQHRGLLVGYAKPLLDYQLTKM